MGIAIGESGRTVNRMPRYIDADALIDDIRKHSESYFADDFAHEWVDKQPSADVQPLRHGRWETVEGWDGDELYRCSECGDEFVLIEGTPNDNNYWFCPHCGADMRGEQNGTD